AAISDHGLRTLRASVEIANRENWAGTHKFEVVEFDSKNNPQEAALQFKNATDQGIRFMVQGFSSSVSLALIEAVNKFNERNPGKEVLLLIPTANAPVLTNEACSFWSFRFTPDVDMQLKALVGYAAKDKALKKVYLINQNYEP